MSTPTNTPISAFTSTPTATQTATNVPANTSVPPTKPPSPPSVSISGFLIPLTGETLIDLDCNTVVWLFGVKFTFYNLCEQQARIERVSANDLPGSLPAGYSFVRGLRLDILTQAQFIQNLPDGTGVEMDFPFFNASPDAFTVLYWNDPEGDGTGEWLEVTKPLSRSQLNRTLTVKSADELYRVATAPGDRFYPALTTDKTGIFILVKK